ncbi:MAG: DUF2017 family protein [Microbacterium sp.]
MSRLLMEMSLLEAAHLTDLVAQFVELLETTIEDDPLDDPALARLVPSAYTDDAASAAEFRRLTQDDLLDRRKTDAVTVLTMLQRDGAALHPEDLGADDAHTPMVFEVDDPGVAAWLRTLAALRLVLATRLGIVDDDDHDGRDPRFGIYDWLGYRLDGMLEALED